MPKDNGIRFIENGKNIILRATGPNTETDIYLNMVEFHELLEHGADILERRINHGVYEVEAIKRKIPKVKK